MKVNRLPQIKSLTRGP